MRDSIAALKENTNHGTVKFPMALYEWNGESEWQVTTHWHEEMELICFKEGNFKVCLNMKEYEIQAPAIMCVHPEELHSILLSAKGSESAIVFSLNILSFEHYDAIQAKLIGPLVNGKLRFPLLITQHETEYSITREAYDRVENKIRIMNHCTSKQEIEKNACYLQVKSILLDLLAKLYCNNSLEVRSDLKSENDVQIANLKKVLTYIHNNLENEIGLEELSELVNMNPQYFCRYFKKNIGKTITEYINELRIEKASQALAETKDKIIDIAQDCGYDNVSYFIRRFKREKGITPMQYRLLQYKER